MKKVIKNTTLASLSLLFSLGVLTANAQESKKKEENKGGDRNVMLNASDNTGPRDVNIGLPAGTGGTTILENGLPAVYFYWPELPTKAWRKDAMLSGTRLMDVGETAIRVGDVGFAISTYDNLGTDKHQVRGSLNSNHFGLLRGDMNVSGPIGKHGTKYSVGAYGSFDPGTYDTDITKYFTDRAQFYKAALSQDYKIDGLTGSISVFYKYAKVEGVSTKLSPFHYGKDGKVKELDNFRIGRDSYFERTGKLNMYDAFTNQYRERDILKDYGTESHSIDLINKNTLSNGLNINFILRYRGSKSGQYSPVAAGLASSNTTTRFVYADAPTEVYQGEQAQSVLNLASKKTPLRSVQASFEIGKKSGKHEWMTGVDQWHLTTDKFATESAQYFQEIGANPRKLIQQSFVNGAWVNGGLNKNGEITNAANEYGDFGINGNLEYYNGKESKTNFFITDKWDVADFLILKAGARLTLNEVNGDYYAKADRKAFLDANPGKPLDAHGNKTSINHHWWLKAFMINATYKMTNKFGLLGDFVYNEEGSHLNKYSTGNDPNLKVSKIPSAGFGLYFNHKYFSVVSKATYINRDQYRSTVNFSNPKNPTQIERVTASYDIQTIGWTTDILAKPFKGFDLHLLFTYQSPKYKKFTGDVDFGGGQIESFDFSDKTVTGVPKFLLEIDPSYRWNNLRVWASARYFSKQYFNKPNTLYMAGRWETFAGASYKITKNLDASVTFVNLLNQKGANGSMSDGDLITSQEDADKKDGQIMAGSYIRPFTAEFGLKFKF